MEDLGQAVASAFPDLDRVSPLTALGEGFGSLVVETAGGVVFRIGKNLQASEGYALEERLMPLLQPRLSVPVPEPRWTQPPSDLFPFGLIGYPKLSGQPLRPDSSARGNLRSVAADIARFLYDLHRVPRHLASAIGVPGPPDPRLSQVEEVRDEVMPALKDILTGPEQRRVSQWWDAFLKDERMKHFEPVVRHGDLWYEHILVDCSVTRVLGVLDFEDTAIGDPAVDFATQLYLGKDFAKLVVTDYAGMGGVADPFVWHRIERLQVLRSSGDFGPPSGSTTSLRSTRRSRNCAGRLSSISVGASGESAQRPPL